MAGLLPNMTGFWSRKLLKTKNTYWQPLSWVLPTHELQQDKLRFLMALQMICVLADAKTWKDNVNYGQNQTGRELKPWQEAHLTETTFAGSFVWIEISIYMQDAGFYFKINEPIMTVGKHDWLC